MNEVSTSQAVIVVKSKPDAIPAVANGVATSLFNDVTILYFAYADPLAIGTSPAGASPSGVPKPFEVTAFSQIAIPRSVFAQTVLSHLKLISQLPDRDSAYLWAELKRVIQEAG